VSGKYVAQTESVLVRQRQHRQFHQFAEATSTSAWCFWGR